MQISHINIVNKSVNSLPAYATSGASGMDIRADLTEPITLQPMERYLVSTGLYLEMPHGYEAQIRTRSGLAINKGITCLNSPGTIDSDYRGEIKVILINLSNTEQVIHPGDRIAQMVIAQIEQVELITVHKLNGSERGEGGFGHSGIK